MPAWTILYSACGILGNIHAGIYKSILFQTLETPTFSVGVSHYSLRNPIRQIPRIKHEFPRHSLRYKLIETLNNTSETIIEMAISQSQENFIAYIKNDMIATYSDCCDIPNCYICSDT